jgi:hypothetical protein
MMHSLFCWCIKFIAFASAAGPDFFGITGTLLLLLLSKKYAAHFFEFRLHRNQSKRGSLSSYWWKFVDSGLNLTQSLNQFR